MASVGFQSIDADSSPLNKSKSSFCTNDVVDLGELSRGATCTSSAVTSEPEQSTNSALNPTTAATSRKRLYSAHSAVDWRASKRRKRYVFVPRTKFLLGGSSSDPLNLGSLNDDGVARSAELAVTPVSSPMPTPRYRKERLDVIIPQDVSDPLGLNAELSEPGHIRAHADLPHADRLDPGPTTGSTSAPITTSVSRKWKNKKRRKVVSAPVGGQTVSGAGISAVTRQLSAPASVSADRSQPTITADRRFSADHIPLPSSSSSTSHPAVTEPRSRSEEVFVAGHVSDEDRGASTDSAHLQSATSSARGERLSVEGESVGDRRDSATTSATAAKTCRRNVFQYGNYNRYYGYRNPTEADPRLRMLKCHWLADLDVLDIGCNVGHVTLAVARDYAPRRCIGIDIDPSLIKMARKNVRRYQRSTEFPSSMSSLYGQLAPLGRLTSSQYPGNVSFLHANFVLATDAQLETVRPEFDFIFCLSITKWVHLNFGDAGLRRFFRRAFLCLRPGGRMLLEAQPWPSYVKKKKITPVIWENFQKIRLRPDSFPDLLLNEIGFHHYEPLGRPHHNNKGFNRQLQLYIKAGEQKSEPAVSPPTNTDVPPSNTDPDTPC